MGRKIPRCHPNYRRCVRPVALRRGTGRLPLRLSPATRKAETAAAAAGSHQSPALLRQRNGIFLFLSRVKKYYSISFSLLQAFLCVNLIGEHTAAAAAEADHGPAAGTTHKSVRRRRARLAGKRRGAGTGVREWARRRIRQAPRGRKRTGGRGGQSSRA